MGHAPNGAPSFLSATSRRRVRGLRCRRFTGYTNRADSRRVGIHSKLETADAERLALRFQWTPAAFPVYTSARRSRYIRQRPFPSPSQLEALQLSMAS